MSTLRGIMLASTGRRGAARLASGVALASFVWIASGAGAHAQEDGAATAAASSSRVGVLLLGVAGVDEETAGALTEVLISVVAQRGGIEIFDSEVFAARLGQNQREAVECVSQPPCVGRVAIELGLATVVTGTVGAREGGYTFSLHRTDARTGRSLGSAFEEVDGDLQAVIVALRRAVPQLYVVRRRVATLLVRASVDDAVVEIDGREAGVAPVRRRDVRPGRHRVVVRAPGHRPWRRDVVVEAGAVVILEATLGSTAEPASGAAVALTVTGGALAVAGGASGLIFGLLSQTDVDERTRADAVDAVDQRETQALVANVSFVAAGVGAATALFFLVFRSEDVFGGSTTSDDDDRASRPPSRPWSVVAAPTEGGVMVGAGGAL